MIPGRARCARDGGSPLLLLQPTHDDRRRAAEYACNLTRWIQHPQAGGAEDGDARPRVQQDEAYDIAAYLYTLRGPEGTSWID